MNARRALHLLLLASSVLCAGNGARAAGLTFANDIVLTVPPSTQIGRSPRDRIISLTIILPSRDPDGLASFIAHVSRPEDPLYRHYLTPALFTARYGPQSDDYRAVVSWAKTHSLKVGEEYQAHTALAVSGRIEQLENAFGISFFDYNRSGGGTFYSAQGTPRLTSAVATKIASVIGFNNIGRPHPLVRRLPLGSHLSTFGSGPLGGLSAADIRNAYQVPAAPTTVPGETLAVFEAGGFAPSDVDTYIKRNGLPKRQIVVRKVNSYGGGIDDPDVELESVLDIDMILATNPGARKIIVYEDGEGDPFGTELVNSLAAIGSDNLAQTVSISYGEDEALQNVADIKAENLLLQQLAAQGISVFASSGDHGAVR